MSLARVRGFLLVIVVVLIFLAEGCLVWADSLDNTRNVQGVSERERFFVLFLLCFSCFYKFDWTHALVVEHYFVRLEAQCCRSCADPGLSPGSGEWPEKDLVSDFVIAVFKGRRPYSARNSILLRQRSQVFFSGRNARHVGSAAVSQATARLGFEMKQPFSGMKYFIFLFQMQVMLPPAPKLK